LNTEEDHRRGHLGRTLAGVGRYLDGSPRAEEIGWIRRSEIEKVFNRLDNSLNEGEERLFREIEGTDDLPPKWQGKFSLSWGADHVKESHLRSWEKKNGPAMRKRNATSWPGKEAKVAPP